MTIDRPSQPHNDATTPLAFSIVIPVLDEEGNIPPLLAEIEAAVGQGRDYEILFIDDGSQDRTVAEIREAMQGMPQVRLLQHNRRAGKSEALRTGARGARGRLLVTIDGDLQNDPADIPKLLSVFEAAEKETGKATVGLLAGQRVKRQDPFPRGFVSRIANDVRAWLLNDDTRDTACGFKIIRRDVFFDLPFFSGLHRFFPALVAREGFRVLHEPVNHRPRASGVAKYNTWNRLWGGIGDLLAIYWFIKRFDKPDQVCEVTPDSETSDKPTP